MMNRLMWLQIQLYKNYILSRLMDKYDMNARDTRKAILESHLLDFLAEFPEEVFHVDVENTADDIYLGHKMRWANEQ